MLAIKSSLPEETLWGMVNKADHILGIAQHDPVNPHEERFLHGAACHGCLLIAETSCERRNEMLDRALVVPTVTVPDAAFFADAEILSVR